MMRKFAIVIAGAALVITGCSGESEPTATESEPTVAEAAAATEEPMPTPEPEPEFYTPKPDDFELEVVELEKRCFGSAGCNVTYRVEVAGASFEAPIDPDITYELVYELEGGDDPEIGRLSVTGERFNTENERRIGTPSSDSELVATVTRVVPVGGSNNDDDLVAGFLAQLKDAHKDLGWDSDKCIEAIPFQVYAYDRDLDDREVFDELHDAAVRFCGSLEE